MLKVLASTFLLFGMAAAAHATTLTVTGMEYANPTTIHVKSASPALDEYVYAGAFSTKDFNTVFESWCVDIFKNTYFNQTVTDYTLKSGATVLGQAKANLLGQLATESLAQVSNATTSSAFQLAIWEILNEAPTNTYSLNSGNFSVYGASDASVALAQNWLNHLPGTSTYSLQVYESPTHQNLGVFKSAKVPEPATIGLLSLGLLGLATRRRALKK